MSFQGPGTGLTGTGASFTAGYAQSAGNINGYAPAAGNATYAVYAGSAGNINGYAPQAGYANQSAVTSQTLQLTSASSSTWGWQGQNSTPAWLWGSNQGNSDTVFAPGNLSVGYANSAGNINGYAPAAGNATYAAYAGGAGNINGTAPTATYANNLAVQGIGGSTWAWAGAGGIPNHYWGSNQGGYHQVWQANQGYVGYAGSAGNINGYAPAAGNVQQSGNYPVWVTGGSNIYAVIGGGGGYSQMFNNGVNYIIGNQAAAYQGTFSGYFAYSVYCAGRFFIASDKRTKKRVTDGERPQYLETVNKLEVERFKFVDTVKNGESTVTGFFAQDVESVIPNAVERSPDFIPSIMKKATKVEGRRITCDNHGLVTSDRVKLHIDKGEGDEGIFATVTNVINDNIFEVDNYKVQEPLYVYGKLVDDFAKVDENKILPHTVGAIQELHLIIKGLEKRIENLESLVIK